MKNWFEMTDQEQVYLWWEYNAAAGEDIPFEEFEQLVIDQLGDNT